MTGSCGLEIIHRTTVQETGVHTRPSNWLASIGITGHSYGAFLSIATNITAFRGAGDPQLGPHDAEKRKFLGRRTKQIAVIMTGCRWLRQTRYEDVPQAYERKGFLFSDVMIISNLLLLTFIEQVQKQPKHYLDPNWSENCKSKHVKFNLTWNSGPFIRAWESFFFVVMIDVKNDKICQDCTTWWK